MQNIKEIIASLTSGEGSLTSALLKTKVLLHDLDQNQSKKLIATQKWINTQKSINKWINNELTGYSESDYNIPNYRLIELQVWGNATNHPATEFKKSLTEAYFRGSIEFIEGLPENKELRTPIPLELYLHRAEPFKKGYVAHSAWTAIAYVEMSQIITQVRSRLLKFLSALSNELPSDIDNKEDKPIIESSDVNKLFNNAIFGDNVTVIIGDSNVSKNQNSVIKHDIESLVKALKDNKITQSDIDSLKEAIAKDKDTQELQQNNFGFHVLRWLGNMTVKTASKAFYMSTGAELIRIVKILFEFFKF